MHMDMSQEAFCAEIYRENAGRFRYHLDWTPGLNTYRKNPSVWTHCWGNHNPIMKQPNVWEGHSQINQLEYLVSPTHFYLGRGLKWPAAGSFGFDPKHSSHFHGTDVHFFSSHVVNPVVGHPEKIEVGALGIPHSLGWCLLWTPVAGLVNGMLRQGLPRASINFGVSEKDPKGAAIGMAIFGFQSGKKTWPFCGHLLL